jgi:hypothetical protein
MPLLGVVVGAALGYGIAELRDYYTRRRQRHGHLEALGVELQMCGDIARGYLSGKVMAPAYRMPMIAYERSLPALLAEGVLTVQEMHALMRYYVNAIAFNFALDLTQQVLMVPKEDRAERRLEREAGRARLKAEKLSNRGASNHYTAAIGVIRSHLPEKAARRLAMVPASELVEEEAD